MGKQEYFAEQRVSDTVKHSDAYTREVTDDLIKRAISLDTNNKDEVASLIDAMNGILDTKEYSYVLNPYHSDNPDLTRFPAKLRNYNIITPIWNKYLGEMIKARKPIKVGVNNPDSINKFKEDLHERVKAIVQDKLARSFNKNMGTEIPTQDKDVDLEALINDYTENWNDQRAIFGQEAINKLEKELDLEYKFWEAYLDWAALGQFYTVKDVYKDDVVEDIVSPLEYYPIGSADFVEDDDAGVRIYRLSITEILTRFGDRLSKKDYKELEDLTVGSAHNIPIAVPQAFRMNKDESMDDITRNSETSAFSNSDHSVEIAHCVFKAPFRIKILTYRGILGDIKTKEVSDDYIIDRENGDLELAITWVNKVYESYRFGPEGGAIYINVSQILVQRSDLNNTSSVKLPYGGKRFMFTNVYNHSIVKALLPYQMLYNIIHRYREMAIAKNKGKLLVLPKGIIANDNEITTEKALYIMKADGTMLVDETEDNFANAINGLKQVDLSDSSYIVSLGGILQEIKEEAWDEVSMNRQRFGQSYASDGKATTEQAVFRASVGSLPINEVFNKAMEKEYEALLDFSKMAWIDEDGTKNKGAFINSENRLAYFAVNGRHHLETNYGVFISNSFQEAKKSELYEQLVFAIGQQGNMEVASQGIEAGNNAQLRKIIRNWRKAEDAKIEAQQQAEQQQVQAQQQAEEMKQQREDAKFQAEIDTKLEIEAMGNENAIILKEMELSGKSEDNASRESIADRRDDTATQVADINAQVQKFVTKLSTDSSEKVARMNKQDKSKATE